MGLHPATLGKCQVRVHFCPELCQTTPNLLYKEVIPTNKPDYSNNAIQLSPENTQKCWEARAEGTVSR